MKKLIVIVMLIFVVSGCSGVILSKEYAQLLDRQCAWADEINRRAYPSDPNLTPLTDVERSLAFDIHARTWRQFRDASKGEK